MNTDHLVQIKRYPFGRWSLYRELIDKNARSECDTCPREGKFVYYTWADGVYAKPKEIKGIFCSKSCMAMYHNFWDV